MTDTSRKNVHIREIASDQHLNVAGTTEMLRLPYDAYEIEGPARLDQGTVVYRRKGETLVGQIQRGQLSECSPGERVLVPDHVFTSDPLNVPCWWLCEVEAIAGDDYA